MAKTLTYISHFSKVLVLSVFLSVFSSANGQVQDSVATAIDTILSVEEATDDEISTRFEALMVEDQQPVLMRQVDTHKVAQLKKDDAFWYINTVPEKAKRQVKLPPKAPASGPDQEWIRNLLWLLVVGGFVALIIWFLVSSDVLLFRKPPPVVDKLEEEEEYSTENLFDIDYETALKRAIAAQNYRLAIRLLYLQTLRDLALRNIIQYRQERTNSEYLMQLFQTSYYRDFFRLTRNFEYAWYGQFEVSKPAFEQIKNEFSSFKQKMPS